MVEGETWLPKVVLWLHTGFGIYTHVLTQAHTINKYKKGFKSFITTLIAKAKKKLESYAYWSSDEKRHHSCLRQPNTALRRETLRKVKHVCIRRISKYRAWSCPQLQACTGVLEHVPGRQRKILYSKCIDAQKQVTMNAVPPNLPSTYVPIHQTSEHC